MYRWRNYQFHADKNNTELAALISSQAQISTVKHGVCDEQVRGGGGGSLVWLAVLPGLEIMGVHVIRHIRPLFQIQFRIGIASAREKWSDEKCLNWEEEIYSRDIISLHGVQVSFKDYKDVIVL